MAEPTTREATCSCGQLRAEVSGEPVRVSICHCYACQQRTGSAFGFQARYAAEDVRITGEATEFTRASDDGEGSGTFRFCPHCGATVWYTTADSEAFIAIPVGAFADSAFPAPGISVWEDRRHGWVSVPEGAERIA
jgi:hypothetical protein